MNQDKYVFAQVVEFLNEDKFRRIVAKYNGNHYVKSYSVWNQLLTLIFGQLSRSPSLRDCVIALQTHRDKLYHLGIGKMLRGAIYPRQMSNETIASLRILPIT